MEDLENLRSIKYYAVHSSTGHYVAHFATKEEAEKYIVKKQQEEIGKYCTFRVEKRSVVDLIEEKCEKIRNDTYLQIIDEKSKEMEILWRDRYEEKLAERKKELGEKMKYILLEFFGIDKEVED